MKFCKQDNTILKDNILHLCLELNFVDIKTLKFPMCEGGCLLDRFRSTKKPGLKTVGTS